MHLHLGLDPLADPELAYEVFTAKSSFNRTLSVKSDVIGSNTHFLVESVSDVDREYKGVHLLVYGDLADALTDTLEDDKPIVALELLLGHIQLIATDLLHYNSSV